MVPFTQQYVSIWYVPPDNDGAVGCGQIFRYVALTPWLPSALYIGIPFPMFLKKFGANTSEMLFPVCWRSP